MNGFLCDAFPSSFFYIKYLFILGKYELHPLLPHSIPPLLQPLPDLLFSVALAQSGRGRGVCVVPARGRVTARDSRVCGAAQGGSRGNGGGGGGGGGGVEWVCDCAVVPQLVRGHRGVC